MSSTKIQEHPRGLSLKDLITWTITLVVLGVGAWGTMKVNEAIMNTKFNDFKNNQEIQNQYFDKRLDKQDEKLDEIIDGITEIKLQLKDKQNRPGS